MQQAARVSDRTAFFTTEINPESDRQARVCSSSSIRRARCSPTRTTSTELYDQQVRMMSDLRPEFHNELDDLRNEVARLGAYVVELIPRVTDILLQQDLEGAEYVLRNDAEIDARRPPSRRRRSRCCALQAPVARPTPGRVCAEAGAGDRALRRSLLQRLQGGAPDLRTRSRPEAGAA